MSGLLSNAMVNAAPRLTRYQINVAHHAGVMHLPAPLALSNFLPQIWQPNIGPILAASLERKSITHQGIKFLFQ